MTFDEVLEQALEMLRRRGRVSYRALKVQFHLDADGWTPDGRPHHTPNTGGSDDVDNLCWCCWWCNVYKSSQVTAPDSRTGSVVLLFHPRQDLWETHFRWSRSGVRILGRTATGRATVEALRMNAPDRVETRHFWGKYGVHPRGTT